MITRIFAFGIVLLFAASLVAVAAWPQIDLIVSGWFYKPYGGGFFLAEDPVLTFFHVFAVKGAWALGCLFVLFIPLAALNRRGFGGLRAKGWLFLLLALLIGPILIAN